LTKGRVRGSGRILIKGQLTFRRVVGADGIAKEGGGAVGRVVAPAGVGIERIETVGGVVSAGGVAFERLITGRRVVVGLVEMERPPASGGIGAPGGVLIAERDVTGGGIVTPSGVAFERILAASCVFAAGGILKQRSRPGGRVHAAGGGRIVRRSIESRIGRAGHQLVQRAITFSG